MNQDMGLLHASHALEDTIVSHPQILMISLLLLLFALLVHTVEI